MPLLTLADVSLAYGHRPLLQRAGFQIDKGERVCLVGRNGAGKSTLLRLITGGAEPDEGEIWRTDPLRVSYLEQDPAVPSGQTVFDVVAAGLGDLGRLLGAYHEAVQRAPAAGEAGLHDLADLQQRIEVLDGWNIQQKVETVLTRLDLPADKPLADCSGGVRRRALLAQALVSEPDLLLLDEPTNHMDIAAITWLEQFLLGFAGALVFITHDRAFLRHLATRIVELDRGTLTSFPGDFDHYLRRKEAMLEAEEKAAARLDRRLAEHEAWIRQGIKARRSRNQGRVKTLLALRRARAERVAAQGRVRLEAEAGDLSGKIVADLRDVRFAYGGHAVIEGLSTRILRGDRVGIIGPNGCGKSTLLKLILGQIKPDSGRVVLGTRLESAYFDQHRADLDPDKTVRENISEGSDYVTLRGRRRHVIGYLRDFLFPAERVDSPVRSLSGGERNRVLLARIFLQPANLLVLDEPTNDLDVETLELLEDLLADYEGTLLLVSHDRAFVDNVVTSVLAFEGEGRVIECVGGYEDWLAQRVHQPRAPEQADGGDRAARRGGRERGTGSGRQKLGYREQRELEALPARIEALEREQQVLEARVSAPEFYRDGDKAGITATLGRLDQVRAELEQAYERWEYLEGAG